MALVDEYFSFVFKLFYRHESNPVPDGQHLLHAFFVCCKFQIYSDYYVGDIKIKANVLFLDKALFFHTFAPVIPHQVHSCTQIYQIIHARINARFNFQSRIVWVASKASERLVRRANSSGVCQWRHITLHLTTMKQISAF